VESMEGRGEEEVVNEKLYVRQHTPRATRWWGRFGGGEQKPWSTEQAAGVAAAVGSGVGAVVGALLVAWFSR
jgi:hypothetical protein